ncbi:MAG: hypothetical protein AAGI68_16250 [Planctomycetota bacterium]
MTPAEQMIAELKKVIARLDGGEVHEFDHFSRSIGTAQVSHPTTGEVRFCRDGRVSWEINYYDPDYDDRNETLDEVLQQ